MWPQSTRQRLSVLVDGLQLGMGIIHPHLMAVPGGSIGQRGRKQGVSRVRVHVIYAQWARLMIPDGLTSGNMYSRGTGLARRCVLTTLRTADSKAIAEVNNSY